MPDIEAAKFLNGAGALTMNVVVKRLPKPSIIDRCKFIGIRGGRRVWWDEQQQWYYTWDSQHGEVEAFTRLGRHVAVLDPSSGQSIKPAVKGRAINV